MKGMKKSCAVTGPKPTRFKFGYKEDYSLCKKIKRPCWSNSNVFIMKRASAGFILAVLWGCISGPVN